MKNTALILLALIIIACDANAQSDDLRVLWIGNSYTYVNDLPAMTKALAASTGRTMVFDQVASGGATFQNHCTNTGAVARIAEGGWTHVILQGQSQEPSFPWSQFSSQTLPYALRLADTVYRYNPCATPLYYMTWGRKNGDASNAPYFDSLATYEGMDNLLAARYTYMAQQSEGALSPVGRVWRHLRTDYPSYELYQSDESHPSLMGSYAAACTFFSILYGADPTTITDNQGIDSEIASNIRNTVKQVVFDSLNRYTRHLLPSSLSATPLADSLRWSFSCQSPLPIESYNWSFGDGNYSNEATPSHTYSTPGNYAVELILYRHCLYDTVSLTVEAVGQAGDTASIGSTAQNSFRIFPNPASNSVTITTSYPVQVSVCDLQGRIVVRFFSNGGSSQFSTAELPNGIYILRADGHKPFRMVVEN